MSKTTVYLHIGAPKTGTSALQYFLLKNRGVLTSKGIEYPAHPVDSNWISSGNAEPLVQSLKERDEFQAKCTIEDVLRCDSEKVVLSSEYLYRLDESCIKTLKELLSPVSTKIIVYLRRQDFSGMSAYSQAVKRAKITSETKPWIMEQLSTGRFSFKEIAQWSRYFGKENMTVRIYEVQQFIGGNIFSDFLNILELPMTEEYERLPKRINTAYRMEALEFMRLLNFLPLDINTIQVDHLLQSYSECMGTEGDWPYSLMSPVDRRKLIEYFNEANAVIARDYLGRPDGRLFYEPLPDTNEPWKPYPGLSVNQVRQIASYLAREDYRLSKQIGLAITQVFDTQDKYIQKAVSTLVAGFELFMPGHYNLRRCIIDVGMYCRYRLQRSYRKLQKKLNR
jgi:hypothetical protein